MASETKPADEVETDGPLLFGRVLDGGGGGRPIGWEEARNWEPAAPREVIWLHICRNQPGVHEWLTSLALPEPTVELMVSNATRPRAFRDRDTLVATLRGINLNPGAEPEDMVSMQVWSDGARVFTFRRLPLQSPRDVLNSIDAGTGPTSAGALVTSLVEQIIARLSPSILDLDDEIDVMEAADSSEETGPLLDRIVRIRRNVLGLKRHMAPEHEALEAMVEDAPTWFSEHDRRVVCESIEKLRRYLDNLDISKESALVLQDDIRARALARSERTSFLLTLVASIFLPLTFITGLLGMNVNGIPAANSPHAFWAVVGLCGAILAVQLVLFWKWKWL